MKLWLENLKLKVRHGHKYWTVLTLHEVNSREHFEEFLESVQNLYTVVSLSDGFRAMKSGAITNHPLFTLTFDDGDKTVHDR